jgi:lysophospholipase L1-like esterase
VIATGRSIRGHADGSAGLLTLVLRVSVHVLGRKERKMRSSSRGMTPLRGGLVSVLATVLVPSSVPAAPDFATTAALGDSLTAPWGTYEEYVAYQLGVSVTNLAVAGANSGSLLTDGQHTAAVDLGATFAFLWIGGNDMLTAANNGDLQIQGETGWIDRFEFNFATALDTLLAGGTDVIVANIFDFNPVTGLPAGRTISPRHGQYVRENMETYTARLQGVADARGVPVVDVFGGWEQMLANPPTVYGHTVVNEPGNPLEGYLWADIYHPNWLGHKFLANMFIDTMNDHWGMTIPPVTLPEPTTGVLVFVGAAALLHRRARRTAKRTAPDRHRHI